MLLPFATVSLPRQISRSRAPGKESLKSTNRTLIRAIIKLCAVITLSFGATRCATHAPRESTFIGKGMKVGSVVVTVDQALVTGDRLDVFNKSGGTDALQRDIVAVLKGREIFEPSNSNRLSVVVDNFKLRHGATRFFTGLYSGSDNVEGKVTILDGRKIIFSHHVEVSGGNGNPMNVSRDSRSSALFKGFGQKIFKLLTNTATEEKGAEVAPNVRDESVEQGPRGKRSSAKSKVSVISRAEENPSKCGTDQIRAMKKAKLSEEQITAACQ